MMRYVDGTDLGTLLEREGPLAPERAAQLVVPVAAALHAAHRRGLVHRAALTVTSRPDRRGPMRQSRQTSRASPIRFTLRSPAIGQAATNSFGEAEDNRHETALAEGRGSDEDSERKHLDGWRLNNRVSSLEVGVLAHEAKDCFPGRVWASKTKRGPSGQIDALAFVEDSGHRRGTALSRRWRGIPCAGRPDSRCGGRLLQARAYFLTTKWSRPAAVTSHACPGRSPVVPSTSRFPSSDHEPWDSSGTSTGPGELST